MHEAYVTLNGVRTKVTTYGKWVEESLEDNKDVVIVIPGNPGVTRFYDKFGKTLYDQLGYPVWCVGHAGHNIPEEKISPFPQLKTKPDLYGLKGQIEHKVDFFKKYVPDDARVHLIGHSIGSYMILELLAYPSIRDKISNVYLLFPTIEQMANTSNGKFLTRFVKPILWLVIFLSWLVTLFPRFFQTILIYLYMFVTGIASSENCESIRDLIKPAILKRVFFLAFEELDQVQERNNKIISENVKKIRFYYGKYDRWAPGSFCERLQADIPNVNAEVCTYNHTFVLTTSTEIGCIVSDWIKGKQ